MKPRYIRFNGKHPAANKENRQYMDSPPDDCINYGAAYSADFLKVDIDDYDHATGEIDSPIHGKPRSEAIVAILDALSVRYNGIMTDHGKHLFFRAPNWLEKKNKIDWHCPLGVKMEWHFPTSDDHIPLKVNGVERQFFKGSIDNEDIDELPYFLYPLQKGNNKPFELEFPEGDRTQKLGAYLFHLVNKKYSAQQAFRIVRLMNEYVFENPIPVDLLDAQILNDSTKRKLQDHQKEKSISHSDIAKEIIGRFDLITVNGEFYTYQNGVYKPFTDGKITSYLTERYPKLNSTFEREVTRHIRGLTFTEYPKDNGMINVRNGILQFDGSGSVSFLPHSKEYISFKQFNALYNPDAACPMLEDTLLKVFDGNSAQIEIFNQVLGYLLMNHVRYQKIFFFVGIPGTGKTTVLMLIRNFCGEENVSAIQLDDMNKPFGLASIVNKTANIFSDIKKSKVLASDVFKMLADGSPIRINQKYKAEFDYCYTGKLLFGMNSFPDFSADLEGVERRLVIFEFKHLFKKSDPDFDPDIFDKLATDECMSALLNKAISGYKTLIDNKGFNSTKESEAALLAFVSDNDTVVRWLHEMEINEDHLLREPIKTDTCKGLYHEYQAYCISIGETAKAQKDFTKIIKQRYGFDTYRPRFNGIQVSMFRRK